MNVVARPSTAVVWWRTLRPATLWAGAVPVFVGTALAYADGATGWTWAALALLGALALQVGCNLVNDYADFAKGADTPDRLGPARASASGWLTPTQVKLGAAVAFAVAIGAGVGLVVQGGWPIALLGVASVIAAIGYTAGPYPLGYLGLGDVFVLGFFGFGAVVGTYYLGTGATAPLAWAAGFAVGALATAILVVNNLRDRHTDVRAGKKTLAVRLGARVARWEYAGLVGAAFLTPIAMAASTGRWGLLLPIAALPLAVKATRSVWTLDGAALNPQLGATARMELIFGLLMTVGALL
ncbi:MAG: 1,4-dihydroxy-2-naphthoate octaprenyltransferase [Bradymonadia bacterium]|jgi:1,4-dihydroxy-2-naphthoate octaprenyltransferase